MQQEIIHPFGGKTQQFETDFCGRKLIIETGKLAFLADGAVTVRYGDTVVLGTAVVSNQPRDGIDFFPLMIDYEERMYATGKISGSRFIKREGRASDRAVLAARLIDRPIRPLFPKGYRNDVQGVATVISADLVYAPDLIAMTAISCALMLSGAPFEGPVAGVRIGLIDGELVAFPTTEQMSVSKLDLTVAGTRDAVMMVEAGASEIDESTMVAAIELAHQSIQPLIKLQEEVAAAVGVKTKEFELQLPKPELIEKLDKYLDSRLGKAIRHEDQYQRHDAIRNLEKEVLDKFGDADYEKADIEVAFRKVIDKDLRRSIVEEGERPDGRKTTDIRPISSQVGVLPRTHGSAIFTRGTTQVLNITTLASTSYGQLIDTMEEDTTKHYIHHYNFPPYSTGEVRPMRSPGRRDIGHGALAERALLPVIPSMEDFPYTIRTVSEVVSSNGSTSMASVCASTLSLMDAGVPITKPVAGIAMGLIKEGDKTVILSDIQGAEDFAGDMDFKVAGTDGGITALQMDIKIKGITPKIMEEALAQAKEGRAHIMAKMMEVLDAPRPEMAPYAPRISKLMINPDKIRDVIGKGGETINKIIAETGVEIDIEDSGLVMIASSDAEASARAIEWIKNLTVEPEVGQIYEGTVVKIMDFGAFVEILPGKDGLVHVSQLADHRVEKVEDEVKVGDKIKVKLVEIDAQGRLNLSKKAVKSEA